MMEKARKATSKSSRSCFVPNCNSGYNSCPEKRSLFRAPRDAALFDQWERAISRTDKKLQHHNSVCELHFEERFIQRTHRYIIHGSEVFLPREVVKLKERAVPTIFGVSSKEDKRKLKAPPQGIEAKPVSLHLTATQGEAPSNKTNLNVERVNRSTMTEAKPLLQTVGAVCPTAPSNVSESTDCNSCACCYLFENLECPSKYWSQQLLATEPLTVSYQTATYTGEGDYPIALDKVVVFRTNETNSAAAVCKVYLRGFLHQEKAVASRREAQDALSYVGRLELCAGVGLLGEFASITLEEAKLRITRDRMYADQCGGSVVGAVGKRCSACKQSRKLLTTRQWKAKKDGKAPLDCVTFVYSFGQPTVAKS
ncbi:uncharacterized protein LOC8029602 [Ixodes scapularis]|uniref:uncharacterized protein LOC8029602 n=1 Tax=Ixodes scapularis TaxID=6945 RepID=UPI001A9CD5ED|nr:uncharacterized protein LOC8029602 [Ixodes scapularis]